MLGEVFYWIFNMSIAAAICGIPILLLRLAKKVPRSIFIWLWAIPFIRMCVPIGITGKFGLMSFISQFTTKTVTIYVIGQDSAVTTTNYVMAASSYFPLTYKIDLLETLFSVFSFIWIIVAVALIFAFSIIYIITISELNDAELVQKRVYMSRKIKSPAVYGIIRPKIIIPYEYSKSDLDYILLHENAHIKRGDNLLRALAMITVCVHWFNPLCWLFLKLLYSDIELACDEAVLSKCNEEQKKEYAHTLVSTVEKTTLFAASFGGAKIRVRVENILSYRKLSVLSLIGFITLIISVAYILLTNAA